MSEKEIINKMLSEGSSNTKIAQVIGCHRTTVPKKIKGYGFDNPNRLLIRIKKECSICGKETSSRRKRCGNCSTKIRRYRAKQAGVEYLGGECVRCEWSEDILGFDFHHVNDKNFNLSSTNMANRRWEVVKSELDKCELLCTLCHRKEHASYYDNEIFMALVNENNGDLVFRD